MRVRTWCMDWPRKLQATILPPTWLHVSHVCEHRQMNIHSILNRRTMVHWRANDVRIARRSTQTDQVQYMLACTYIQAGVHTYRPIAHAGMHIHPLESHFTSCPHEVHTGAHIHGRMHTHTHRLTRMCRERSSTIDPFGIRTSFVSRR